MSKKFKKIKKALSSALLLFTCVSPISSHKKFDWFPTTFSRYLDNVEEKQNYIEAFCSRNNKLSSTLVRYLKKKGSENLFSGKIELVPLNKSHKSSWEKLMDCSKQEIYDYLHYFTKEKELTADKGKRYFDKHMKNMSCEKNEKFIESEKDIFFTIKYTEYEKPIENVKEAKIKNTNYVGIIGLTRAYGGNPDLEIIVSPDYKGLGIATESLKSLIDFSSEYNFTTSKMENQIPCIEAIIADKNIGSQRMAVKNNFKLEGDVPEEEANGHKSKCYIKTINCNPVLHFAKNYDQKLISSIGGEYPVEKMITGLDFFSDKYEENENYESVKNAIEADLSNLDIPDGLKKNEYIELVKSNLLNWPIAWLDNDGSIKRALNISFLEDTLKELKTKKVKNFGNNFITNPLSIEDSKEKIAF